MKITYVEIDNLLSYGSKPSRITFDSATTVIIGPNGGGKTNVFRAIELVRNALKPPQGNLGISYDRRVNPLLQVPPHRHTPHEKSSVTLGIELTTEHEVKLLALFVAASIVTAIKRDLNQSDLNLNKLIPAAQRLGQEFSEQMVNGELISQHNRMPQSEWFVRFSFSINGSNYTNALNNQSHLPPVATGDLYLPGSASFPSNLYKRIHEKLDVGQPDNWSLDNFLPITGERVGLALLNNLNYDDELNSELLRLGLINGDADNKSISLGKVFDLIFDRSFRSDVDDYGFGSSLAFHQTPLLRKLVAPDSTMASTVLADLYQWKVGDLDARRRFVQAQAIFAELRGTGETFDLRSSLAGPMTDEQALVYVTPVVALSKRADVSDRDHGKSLDQQFEVQANLAGSGAAELIRLSYYLAAEPSTVVLLDEPAAQLHPSAQRKLLRFLEETEAQIILVSHSPGLLPLGNVRRIAIGTNGTSTVKGWSTTQTGDDAEVNLQNNRLSTLIRKDPTVASIPFAEAVIFVSGFTEMIAFPKWYQSWLDTLKSTSDIPLVQFVNFMGDGEFGKYLEIALTFGVSWAAIVDGNSYAPPDGKGTSKGSPTIANQIRSTFQAVGSELTFESNDYEIECDSADLSWFNTCKEKLEAHGVWTLANCWKKSSKGRTSCGQPGCNGFHEQVAESCDTPEWHSDDKPHSESFEDFVRNDGELGPFTQEAWYKPRDKIGTVLKLIEEHPECPKQLAELFRNVTDRLKQAPSLV